MDVKFVRTDDFEIYLHVLDIERGLMTYDVTNIISEPSVILDTQFYVPIVRG